MPALQISVSSFIFQTIFCSFLSTMFTKLLFIWSQTWVQRVDLTRYAQKLGPGRFFRLILRSWIFLCTAYFLESRNLWRWAALWLTVVLTVVPCVERWWCEMRRRRGRHSSVEETDLWLFTAPRSSDWCFLSICHREPPPLVIIRLA